MATHVSILAWKIPWTEEAARLYSPWGRKSRAQLNTLTSPAKDIKPTQATQGHSHIKTALQDSLRVRHSEEEPSEHLALKAGKSWVWEHNRAERSRDSWRAHTRFHIYQDPAQSIPPYKYK